MSRDQPASGRQEAPHDGHRDGERWIGHDPEGSSRETEVAGVGLNNGDRATSEPLPELPGPHGMKLHGDDPGPGCDQLRRESARSGANIENKVARLDIGVGDDRSGPALIEPVPSPRWPRLPGHGAS